MGPRTLKRRPQCLRYHTMTLLGYPRISSNISFLPFNSLMGRENKPVSNPCSWALVFPSEVIPMALFMHALAQTSQEDIALGGSNCFLSFCLLVLSEVTISDKFNQFSVIPERGSTLFFKMEWC